MRIELGLTVIAAMHDLTLAGQFSDRLALMAGGKVVVTGTAAEVLTQETVEDHFEASVSIVETNDGIAVLPRRRKDQPPLD